MKKKRGACSLINEEIGVVDSQCKAVLLHMKKGNSICPKMALDMFACFRLAARISDLRKDGHNIDKRMVSELNRFGVKVRYAVYSIKK